MSSLSTRRDVLHKVLKSFVQPRQPLFQLIGGVVFATLSATAFIVLWGVDAETIMLLIGLMLTTGLISIGVGYVLYQKRIIRMMPSLQVSLAANASMSLLILLVNVSAIALSMLVSELDSLVITTLLIFAAILAILFGVLHSRLISQELRELAQALNTLGSTDQPALNIARAGNDEVASLIDSFNRMAQRLHEAEQKQQAAEQLRRDLVAWVSHDLRTPLTSLQVMNDALIDGVVTDSEQTGYLEDMHREIVSLTHLIDSLFELSLLDTGHATLRLQPASLRDLLSAVVSGIKLRAGKRDIEVETILSDEIDPVEIDPEKIQRVLMNVIDNAFQHTEQGGKLRISATRQPDSSVLVSIFNSGSVIKQSDLPKVFEQFFRGDKARRDIDGRYRHAGLGLTIARRFTEAHGGSIWAESVIGQGTTFYFSLPRHTHLALE